MEDPGLQEHSRVYRLIGFRVRNLESWGLGLRVYLLLGFVLRV